MLNLNAIMLGTQQLETMADFYEKVLQKPADLKDEENGYWGWQIGSAFFMVGKHSEVNGMSKEPSRLIYNFETSEVKKEFARIKALGAVVVREPYEMQGGWIATFADPDGNYFQLVSPMEM